MKKRLLFIILSFLLVGCSHQVFENISIDNSLNSNTISNFNLISPANGTSVVKDIPTFEWEEANNATSYILEVCSDTNFNNDSQTYLRKVGISQTSYTLDTYLRTKEVTYYWRVFAVNKAYEVLCNDEYRGFYLGSPDYGEIEFNIDYKDEWTLHPDGSDCDIDIDKSDFFNNGKNSLMLSFTKEYTNHGEPSRDGWIVVTHTQETELYGVDAFYFNFYYNGQDANIVFRVIDADNEYYNADIKLATNAQQTIIIKFSDFTLRTKGGTPIINQVFDYNYIKAVEIVFEQAFGDGVCMISNLKAIHYDDYLFMFITKVNFNDFDIETFIYDNYTKFVPSIGKDGYEFSVSFGSDMPGYGFVKVPVNKTLVNANAFKVKISHTGSTTHKILFRLIEEDGDRWVYRQNCSTLIDDYLIIPFNAFTLSEANGDGARQFYFIKQFQFGIESAYGAGSFTYENLSVCYIEDEIENLYQNQIGSDGMIEDFESYKTNVQMYYKWQNTTINKDESMGIDTQYTPLGIGNSGKFTYKSDMYPACYGLLFTSSPEGFSGISFEVLDKSELKNPSASGTNPFAHLGNGCAKMIVTIYVTKGETYSYVIDKLSSTWKRYDIAFNDFNLDAGFSAFNATPLDSENIIGLRFDFQFYYYALVDGALVPYPQYTSSNPVYFDNIQLTHSQESSVVDVINIIKPDETNPDLIYVEDFNDHVLAWRSTDLEYSNLALSTNTFNNTDCMEMQYKGNSSSVSYTKYVTLDTTCKARAIKLDLKGDGVATVYVNIYFDHGGTVYKYRATIANVSDKWTTYVVGFNNFVLIEGVGSVALSRNVVPEITKISFGIVNTVNSEISHVYVDNIIFDNNETYTANKVIALEG